MLQSTLLSFITRC